MKPLLALALMLAAPLAHAAEGMWTLDRLPLERMKSELGFEPDAAWVDRAMKASVRLAGGCSGSFVSPDGLVLTNNHCIVDCLTGLSTAQKDLLNGGFLAAQRSQELQCPAVELNRLEQIEDVTARVNAATQGLSGRAFNEARNAEKARIESECGSDKTVRCDVVELYDGGLYHRYRYTRYQDVRLVFAPEYDIGFFGGDPDNFNFPRWNLDMALLRAYEKGQPAKVRDWFRFSSEGVKEGDATFVTGHPGSTQRLLTVAQLERRRDIDLLHALSSYSERRGWLYQYSKLGAEQARQAQQDLTFTENSLKVISGQLNALLDPRLIAAKREAEAALQSGASPEQKAAWSEIEAAQRAYRRLWKPYRAIEERGGFYSRHFEIARHLVRAAEERGKPNGERLREYQDAALPQLTQRLFSAAPIHVEFEKAKLEWSLTKLREWLGPDDPFVKLVLGKESPAQLAARLIEGTRLAEVATRKALYEGGLEAIAASQDPFIRLARAVDGPARAVREQYESEVEAAEKKAAEVISRLRFAKLGTSTYPDATFTLRLSYGVVKGWEENGRPIAPFTDFTGLYSRQTGAAPFRLTPPWLERKAQLALNTPFNFVSTNDIIGGNSGSPVINRKGEVVGLAFDGNLHSLGGAYWNDPLLNRMVAVDSRGMIEALRSIYGAKALVQELQPPR